MVLVGHLTVLGEFEALFALPAARMGGHGFVFQGAGELVVVGFDGKRFANKPGGHGIGVAIEMDTKIGVHLGLHGIAAVGQKRRQGAHSAWVKAVDGPLPSGGVASDIGHLIAPLIGLALEIGEITKRSQGPEVIPKVMDRAFFDFPLFLGLPHMAGTGGDLERPQKRQKVVVEAHQGALALHNGGAHGVMDKFPRGALKEVKGIEETLVQGLLPLRMGKFEVEQATMPFNPGQAIEFARGVAIGEGPKVAPVDLALVAGWRFKTDGRLGSFVGAYLA